MIEQFLDAPLLGVNQHKGRAGSGGQIRSKLNRRRFTNERLSKWGPNSSSRKRRVQKTAQAPLQRLSSRYTYIRPRHEMPTPTTSPWATSSLQVAHKMPGRVVEELWKVETLGWGAGGGHKPSSKVCQNAPRTLLLRRPQRCVPLRRNANNILACDARWLSEGGGGGDASKLKCLPFFPPLPHRPSVGRLVRSLKITSSIIFSCFQHRRRGAGEECTRGRVFRFSRWPPRRCEIRGVRAAFVAPGEAKKLSGI